MRNHLEVYKFFRRAVKWDLGYTLIFLLKDSNRLTTAEFDFFYIIIKIIIIINSYIVSPKKVVNQSAYAADCLQK